MREAQRQFDEHGGRACPAQLIAPVLHKVRPPVSRPVRCV